jgi:hypothetical protein
MEDTNALPKALGDSIVDQMKPQPMAGHGSSSS